MEIPVVGLVTVALALAGWIAGQAFATYVFMGSTLLASPAAITLPSRGGANIRPGHLLLGFLTITVCASRKNLLVIGRIFAPKKAFWFA